MTRRAGIRGDTAIGVLFAAFLGYNPVASLLGPGVLSQLPAHNAAVLTGKQFFPDLISGPFHAGLAIVFSLAILLSLLAAGASMPRNCAAAFKKPI